VIDPTLYRSIIGFCHNNQIHLITPFMAKHYDRHVVLFWENYLYFSGFWLPIIVFGIMAFVNIFNFMDGVDGFAGSQAFIMMFASSVLLAFSDEMQWSVPLILMCAPVLGFLAWNWPPAKIFMGDAGSSFMGVFIATLGLLLATDTSVNLWCWLIMMGWFIVDSGWSLVVRIMHGNDWHRSHRMHAYQILARRWENHFYVTLTLWLVNWLWLFPLAYLAMNNERWGVPLIAIAYTPLCFACWRLKAGESVDNDPGEPVYSDYQK
jgi:Fuc2NAc and GlcNAc transferase